MKLLSSTALIVAMITAPMLADPAGARTLVVSRITYTGTASTVTIGQPLPGGGIAVADGSYPNVFENEGPDGSFGVTAPISLDSYALQFHNTVAVKVGTLAIPSANFTDSFSSKSEGALNLSADGKSLLIAGYIAAPNTLDVSNANTPNHVDPTNPDAGIYQRGVAEIDKNGHVTVTPVNAYSGNNIRAAVKGLNGDYYMSGNSNNGTKTPANIVAVNGIQEIAPGVGGETTKVANYSITQNGYAHDKLGKDENFRGLTIFNNTLYTTKGSGGNGIDSVYQVGTAGSLPGAGAIATILPGFPTDLAKTNTAQFYPFGLWFANATTLYVADEGDGVTADAATDPNAGLTKWTLANGVWKLDYVLQNGLGLGQSYSVAGLPAGLDPATDGLRNITGEINGDGTVSIFGLTSTVSANTDQGADPDRLVSITDSLAATALPVSEQFSVLQTANYGEVLRGVSFSAVPEPSSWALLIAGFTITGASLRRRRLVFAG